jgi:hypothetical protein
MVNHAKGLPHPFTMAWTHYILSCKQNVLVTPGSGNNLHCPCLTYFAKK